MHRLTSAVAEESLSRSHPEGPLYGGRGFHHKNASTGRSFAPP